MITVKKLWGRSDFQKLDTHSKLLYIYLATCPQLNTLGICSLTYEFISFVIGFELDDVIKAFSSLEEKKYIMTYEDDYIYVLGHFKTLPQVDKTFKRAMDDMKDLPKGFIKKMEGANALPQLDQYHEFVAPTASEIKKYSMDIGFHLDVDAFIQFYSERDWKDTKGRLVKSWKAKVRFWCRNLAPIPSAIHAPKGYEYFYIIINNQITTPDYWLDGTPRSNKGMLINKKLQEGYEELKRSSEEISK